MKAKWRIKWQRYGWSRSGWALWMPGGAVVYGYFLTVEAAMRAVRRMEEQRAERQRLYRD